jgi:hypothetical protein
MSSRFPRKDQRPPIKPHSPSYRQHSKNSPYSRQRNPTPVSKGKGAQIIYHADSPEEHMMVTIKEYRMHKRRRERLLDFKQANENLQLELQDVYNKNKELSSSLYDATQVINTQQEEFKATEQRLLAGLEEDTTHINSLVQANKNLSSDLNTLKKAWTEANVPLLKSTINKFAANIETAKENKLLLETQLKQVQSEAAVQKQECNIVEEKARVAMDNAVRALNDAAVQTRSAEEELGFMRRSLREAKCYTLHTTLGRVVTAHKQEEGRLTRIVSHLQAALNVEKNRLSRVLHKNNIDFNSKFVTVSGIMELTVNDSNEPERALPGFGVVVNNRALYHFDSKNDCLEFFQEGNNGSPSNVVTVNDQNIITRKLDLYTIVSIVPAIDTALDGTAANGLCLTSASQPSTTWKIYPQSSTALMEWENVLTTIVANNIRLVQLETGDLELLHDVANIALNHIGKEALSRLNAGNCFFHVRRRNGATVSDAARVLVASHSPTARPSKAVAPATVVPPAARSPKATAPREAAMRALQKSDIRGDHAVEKYTTMATATTTTTPTMPTVNEGKGNKMKSWANEEKAINALQQRVHQSHLQKEAAKAKRSKHRSKHSQVLMMVGQALEVCRDSSTPTSPRPTTIPTPPSAPAPPAPPAPPTLPAPPAPPTNGNGTSAEWTTPAISFESMNLDREHLTEMDRAIIQEYMDEQQQQEQQEQLEQQYQDEIFAIDVICDDLNGKIDFEQPDIIQMIHLIKQIELAIDSGDTPKIVMLEAEVHAILSTTTTRGVRRMHFMWEEYFQHKAPPQKVATNTRFQMNQFGKNDSNKPRWNNSGHTTHVGRPNSNSSSTHRHIDQTPVTAPSGAFPSSFSSPPPAAASSSTHTSVSFNPGMYGDGRSRRRSIRMQETLSTMELKEHERNNQQHRHKQRIIDTSSPRSDGMFLNSKPRASLRKSKGFLVASRNAQRHDIYDGSWRTNNAISSMYDCGRRGITNDLGAQRALQKKMQKHKQTMQNDWKNGGRLF